MSSVTADDVEAYRKVHFPASIAKRDKFVAQGGIEIPGNGYVAKLGHRRFHEWFGTQCDATCPHLPYERSWDAAALPNARLRRASWLTRLFRGSDA